MFDIRPIVLVIGILLTTLGCSMLLPAIFDLMFGSNEWLVFSASAAFTLFVGIAMTISSWGHTGSLTIKQAFILTTLSWLMLTTFAALPFAWSRSEISFTDAFFEAMSGLTTTGATIMTELDKAAPGILLWRGLLQWLGGIGIIVMAIAVLPMLQIGGMQIFRMESSDKSEKILPRATQISGSIALIYLFLTIVCLVCYYAAGMGVFDAAVHAMTTIATGGFSNHDSSVGYFDNIGVDIVASCFMIIGSLPFLLYLHVVRGNIGNLYRDSQVRAFIGALIFFIIIIWFYQFITGINSFWQSLRYSIFNVISIVTGTGYATTDYGLWGAFAMVLLLLLMFVGGCSGSASCGIKIFRFQVIYETVKVHLNKLFYPNGVFVPRYNKQIIEDNVTAAVFSFFFLFIFCFAIIAIILHIIGLDNITAISAAASAITNVGPGFGSVGPSGTYTDLPGIAKWVLSFAMLLGRLELFTVLVLFSPTFWRS